MIKNEHDIKVKPGIHKKRGKKSGGSKKQIKKKREKEQKQQQLKNKSNFATINKRHH